jgi:hypothetical protein
MIPVDHSIATGGPCQADAVHSRAVAAAFLVAGDLPVKPW